MLKRNLIIAAAITAFLFSASYAVAAPSSIFEPTVLPQITNTYDLGSASRVWSNVYATQLCLSADCRTSWPSGGAGGGLATTTPWTALQLVQVVSNSAVKSIATSSLGLLTTDVAEGTNLYWTPTRFDNRLSATTSLPNIITLAGLSLPATQLTNFGTPFYQFFNATTTDALAQGSTNKYWSQTLFDNALSATTTLPNLTTLANLGTIKTSLTGLLKASSGVLSAAANGTDYTLITANSCSVGQHVSALTAAGVITCSADTGSGGTGLATTTPLLGGNVLVYTASGAGFAYGTATTSLTSSTGISFTGTPGALIGGTNLTITNSSPLSGLSVGFPFAFSNPTLTWIGLATTSQPSSSNVLVSNGTNGIYGAATSTLTASSPLTGSFTQLGSGGTLGCQAASGSQAGCLASADWTTFNGKQAAGNYITALTGDVTASGPGSVAATLATVNSNVGSFTNASITVNGKGLITAASSGAAPEVPLTFTYPITRTTNTIALAFGTTTSNTWAGTQTFTNAIAVPAASIANASLANSTISGVALGGTLAALSATDSTLTFSGSFTGAAARTVGLNLGNANTWTAVQTFTATTSHATSTFAQVGIGTTSPVFKTDIDGGTGNIFRIIYNATTALISVVNSTVTALGTWDFTGATVKLHTYAAFSYATTTAWTGTTTIPLGPAYVAETWKGVKCFTDTGTLNVSFNDGTNRMDMFNASTTVGTVVLTANNALAASTKRYVDIGTPATTPTKVSCTVDKIINQ